MTYYGKDVLLEGTVGKEVHRIQSKLAHRRMSPILSSDNWGDGVCPYCKSTFPKIAYNQIVCTKRECKNKQKKRQNEKYIADQKAKKAKKLREK